MVDISRLIAGFPGEGKSRTDFIRRSLISFGIVAAIGLLIRSERTIFLGLPAKTIKACTSTKNIVERGESGASFLVRVMNAEANLRTGAAFPEEVH